MSYETFKSLQYSGHIQIAKKSFIFYRNKYLLLFKDCKKNPPWKREGEKANTNLLLIYKFRRRKII